MQFPRLVYKSASVNTLAEDQDQFDALCEEGWYPSVPEALAGKKMPANNLAEPTAVGP